MAGLVLVGWMPAVALVLLWNWRGQLTARTGLTGNLPQIAAQLGSQVQVWWWQVWRISCWLVVPMLLLSLWQGFAERNRLPHYPVLAFQVLVLITWAASSVGMMASVERAIRQRWQR